MDDKKLRMDVDPEETQEWLESLQSVLDSQGSDRAHFLVEKLIDHARRNGVRMPYSPNTAFQNTIPPSQQKPYPGDRAIERRIKSIIRWNAMAMVVRANKESHGIGGHISSYASSATLLEVAQNHFLRGHDHPSGGDLVFFQGHSSPGVYARAFLEGRLSENKLTNFRRESASGGGLSSYPHPYLMPDFWQFATVSMGLGPLMAIYQARFMRYMIDRGFIKDSGRKVWAFLGDGEMDEPESLGAITLASREQLDNLIFVVNCNLQRLDGPVRGNGKIIQELEGAFRGAGWNVIKVIWGSDWDPILSKDKNGILAKRMEEIVDGDLLKYVVEGGTYIREHFWGKHPDLAKMVDHLTDDELWKLRVGGHDPAKVFAAYSEAVTHNGQPTVILARTIKGYGLGEAGEGRNITHSQKKLNEEELLQFRSRFDIPLTDDVAKSSPFYRPDEDSKEVQYLLERRQTLGGFLPTRKNIAEKLPSHNLDFFKELMNGSGDREISTTMAFVRLLTILTKDKETGKNIVPIIPDEARTFGIDPLFRQLGIYSHGGQNYDPVDSDQFLYYKEAVNGQILEEGITEAGAISSFIAAGTSYSIHGTHMIPFYIFYSMFGFQRVGDSIWAAADMRTRGFLLGATAGRTTLAGEGLQHQDGHSHLAASVIPNVRAYDPAFGYEMAVIIHSGLQAMIENDEDVIYYITLYNENYQQPKLPEHATENIIKGMYQYKENSIHNKLRVQLLGSGSIFNEVLAASEILSEDWNIDSDVWSVTSYSELRKDGEYKKRWNILHPEDENQIPFVTECLDSERGPVIAVSDFVKLVAEQIAPFIHHNFTALGTDGFGRSEARAELRDFFEVSRYYIVLAALNSLSEAGKIEPSTIRLAIEKYGLDSEKPNPLTV
ncbi:MAG: pyruvate dehydrogenase (acetyl-transferring), homodimeric type [Candidatus Marinimicrobia bacterium]|nr:pyruvate dehydrogenase (acetyl-transferring), homodimeric type [Candidatus Neomarinimicrobiota bacterium]